MKKILAVLIILGTSILSMAQQRNATVALASTETRPLFLKVSETYNVQATIPGMRMRNAGRTLTICGGALLLGGVIMMSSADALYYTTTYTSNGTVTEGDPKGAFGLLMTIGGVGMIIPGVILWSKGQKKYNRYVERQTVSMNMKGAGLSIRYSL